MPLFVVGLPIGNPQDITDRAKEVLSFADLIVAEEIKPTRRILKSLGLFKEVFLLNEHTEPKGAAEELMPLLAEGQNLALISDCGTPLFADPGAGLVELCHQKGYPVTPVPGASSLTAALSVSGLKLDSFYYAGFLPREREERQKAIAGFRDLACPVLLLEAPYRLGPLLRDLVAVLGGERRAQIFFALTKAGEEIAQGPLGELAKKEMTEKREFVLLIKGQVAGALAPKVRAGGLSKPRAGNRPKKNSRPPNRKAGPQRKLKPKGPARRAKREPGD